MRDYDEGTWKDIMQVVDHILERVERILYVYPDQSIKPSDGPLQLTFDDRSVLLLECAGDGARLKVERSRWVDPFAGPLDEVNARFVEESGKWSLFDLSQTEPFKRIVGKRVDRVTPIYNELEQLGGLQFEIGTEFLIFCVAYDESYVYWGKDLPRIEGWEFHTNV